MIQITLQFRVLNCISQLWALSAYTTVTTHLEIAPDNGMGHLGLIIPLWVKTGERKTVQEGRVDSARLQAAIPPLYSPKLLQKHAGRNFSILIQSAHSRLLTVQLLSQQQGNSPLSTFFASSPGKQEREDSDRTRGVSSRMSQITKDMAVRMLHMTQFLRKKGPITVWIFSPPSPHHFYRYEDAF